MLKRLIVAGVVATLASGSTAGPWEDGVAAYKRKDYAAALDSWQPLAERGDSRAQNNIGVLYEKGLGVTADPEKAAEWYRKAVARGHLAAKKNLADLIATGSVSAESQGPPVPSDGSPRTITLDEWRSVATPFDITRFDRMPTTRAAAIKVAANDIGFAEVRRVIESPTQDIPIEKLRGQWRCRTIKLGGLLDLVIYDYFRCEILGYAIQKTTGSQRFSGRLYVANEGLVFLGASADGDHEPVSYGSDPERNDIGLLRPLGNDHLALELPSPLRESHHNIIELVRDSDRPSKRDPHQRQTMPPK